MEILEDEANVFMQFLDLSDTGSLFEKRFCDNAFTKINDCHARILWYNQIVLNEYASLNRLRLQNFE